MMNTGRLVVISAPSGTGKTTLVARLMERYPEMVESISYTTRPPRANEVDGRDYFFVNRDLFDQMVREGGFIEWAIVHNHHYGTPKELIETQVAAGKKVVLNIDIQGGIRIKQLYPDALLIFLVPPSMDELKARLDKRGANSPDDLQVRLANAVHELEAQHEYDCVIVNDDLDKATDEVAKRINEMVI